MPRPRSARQWFAIKAKLKKSGKWDETKYQRAKEEWAKAKEVEGPPEKTAKLDLSEEEVAALEDAFEFVDEPDSTSGKSMSYNVSSAECNVHGRDCTVADWSNPRKVHDPSTSGVKNAMESEVSDTFPYDDCDFSILHEGGDPFKSIREIKRSYKGDEVSNRASDLRRSNRVSKIKENVRDLTLILRHKTHPIYLRDYVKKLPELPILESYFQSYNSLGIVIKQLPGDNSDPVKLYDLLCEQVTEPFILIQERSAEGILHWHMMWLTSKRSDNAKRTLQRILDPISKNFSIACQTTRSFKHLLRYILKEPISVGVGHSPQLLDYAVLVLREEKPYIKPDTQSNNPVVQDILNAMKEHCIYNYEQLLHKCPDVMIKYLHKPNLESIVNNCKLFLLRPGNAYNILERVLGEWRPYHFFRIWAFLEHQNVDPVEFLLDFWNIFFRTTDKLNVLCLQGASNAGKTTFIRPLLEMFNFGEIVSGGSFMFQNCINKEILIWEEPLIGHDFVEMCKRVFEGMTTQVPVKFKPPQTLYRTPILITTNKDVWYYCSGDEEALRNRMVIYHFNEPAATFSHRPCSFYKRTWENYCRFVTEVCRYVEYSEPDNSTRTQHTQPEGISGDSGDSQPVHTDDKPGSSVDSNNSRGDPKCADR